MAQAQAQVQTQAQADKTGHYYDILLCLRPHPKESHIPSIAGPVITRIEKVGNQAVPDLIALYVQNACIPSGYSLSTIPSIHFLAHVLPLPWRPGQSSVTGHPLSLSGEGIWA